MYKKVEWAHDRLGRCLGYLHAEADLDCSINCTIVILQHFDVRSHFMYHWFSEKSVFD